MTRQPDPTHPNKGFDFESDLHYSFTNPTNPKFRFSPKLFPNSIHVHP